MASSSSQHASMDVEYVKSITMKPRIANVKKEDLKMIVSKLLILTHSIITIMTCGVSSEYKSGLRFLIF